MFDQVAEFVEQNRAGSELRAQRSSEKGSRSRPVGVEEQFFGAGEDEPTKSSVDARCARGCELPADRRPIAPDHRASASDCNVHGLTALDHCRQRRAFAAETSDYDVIEALVTQS